MTFPARRVGAPLGAGTMVRARRLAPPAVAVKSPETRPSTAPLVIGHRGACGYRPEHTLAGYELAIRMGADYIEPDLVPTKDHVLIARHENDITGTTDVTEHPEFADRRTTKLIDGNQITGWFTEDFTLAEIKTLRAIERLPDLRRHNTRYDGLFPVPTLQEILQLRHRLSWQLRREVGIYVEAKHPSYFRSIGLAPEAPLVRALQRAGLNTADAPVYLQSFELTSLLDLRRSYDARTRLTFLTEAAGSPLDLASAGDPRSYADLTTAAGLEQLVQVVDGIGPDKDQVIPRDQGGNLLAPTSLVTDAHRAGLFVHPYTFRAENEFLPLHLRCGTDPADYGRMPKELTAYLDTGIDGFFTDHPDIGVLARDTYLRRP